MSSNSTKTQRVFLFVILTFALILSALAIAYNIESNLIGISLNFNKIINKQYDSYNKEKWIVVTTINEPTEQIKKLASIEGYQLLVIGDTKTNSNWSHTNVIFLNIDKQRQLGYETFRTTPFKSYTRKNIGYMFAIHNGAKFIYDTDDDNAPILNLNTYFEYAQQRHGLRVSCNVNSTVVNPYAHFGQPLMWPRGYPLSEINNIYDNSYECGLKKTSIVQQGLVNGDPDVDAIFRLTKTVQNKRIEIQFDNTAPSIQIPMTKLAPYNSQNTFFHYKAFWSLYLPSTVSFRLTDIWRSYWAQRLMWLTDDTITFHGPNADQIRNFHSYIQDYEEESNMYLQTESLIKLLLNWQCDSKSFFECMLNLTSEMIKNEFFEKAELNGVENWIKDLKSIGYHEPVITNWQPLTGNCKILQNSFLDSDSFSVRFTPVFQNPLEIESLIPDLKQYDSDSQRSKYFSDLCDNTSLLLKHNKSVKSSVSENKIVLLITFNSLPLANNIEFLKQYYSNHFKNIVFCGNNIRSYMKEVQGKSKIFDKYTFIDFNTNMGYNHYYCMTKTIQMGFHANGILLASDDVFIKPFNLNLNFSRIWYTSKSLCKPDLSSNNWWNNKPIGQTAVSKMWNEMNGTSSILVDEYFKIFHSNVDTTTIVCYEASDLFYIPKSKFKSFAFISSIYYKHKVFLEFAVPMILYGLSPFEDIDILSGQYLWGEERNAVFEVFESVKHFVHPIKLADIWNNLKHYCSQII